MIRYFVDTNPFPDLRTTMYSRETIYIYVTKRSMTRPRYTFVSFVMSA